MRQKLDKRKELVSFAKGSRLQSEPTVWIVIDGNCDKVGYPDQVRSYDIVLNIIFIKASNDIL